MSNLVRVKRYVRRRYHVRAFLPWTEQGWIAGTVEAENRHQARRKFKDRFPPRIRHRITVIRVSGKKRRKVKLRKD